MKQLGNLALVCANRPEVLLQLYAGQIGVYIGSGPKRVVLTTAWDNDDAINGMIRELNFGKYRMTAA